MADSETSQLQINRPGRSVVTDQSSSIAGVSDSSPVHADPVLAGWTAGMTASLPEGTKLPPHSVRCLGCGPDNPHGHHLDVHRDGERVIAVHTFDERHVGAPGIAHGGAVATVFDDLFGFLLFIVGELAVTRSLQVDYLAPVRLDTPYSVTANLDRREGRRLYVTAQLHAQGGRDIAIPQAQSAKAIDRAA